MSHDKHTESTINLNLQDSNGIWETREQAKERFLWYLDGFESKYPDPVVVEHDGIRVVRDDLVVGTKARAAEAVLWANPHWKHLVYCQPRTGLAGVSMIDVAKKYDREVTLFMPACKEISKHQAVCIERGAHAEFRRIAAMPNLNKYAREWAEEHGHAFVPMGLKHPFATAGIIRAASLIPEPEVVFVAVSTGVLIRALQIAWPRAHFIGVCVARNLQEGERGEADLISHPLPFQKPVKDEHLPPFPSVSTYDAKAWYYCREYVKEHDYDVLFWNVGTDPKLEDETIYGRVDSNVAWATKKDGLLDFVGDR